MQEQKLGATLGLTTTYKCVKSMLSMSENEALERIEDELERIAEELEQRRKPSADETAKPMVY